MVELGPGVDDGHDRARALRQTPRAGQVEHAALGERPLLVLQRLGGGGARPTGLPALREVAERLQRQPPRGLGLGREDVAVLRLGEPQRFSADPRERGAQRAAGAEELAQRPVISRPHVDASAPQRGHGLAPQAADGPDLDAIPARAEGLGVEVGERLVLGEGLVADDDLRPGLALRVPAEPVGVDELPAHRLRQPPVDHLLVEPAQGERVQQPRGRVQAPFEPGAVALEQGGAHDRHDAVRADHVLVVAQHLDVGARERRIGGERDRDLGDPVVERLDPGVGDGQADEGGGRRRRAVGAFEAGRAVRVRGAVGGGSEPDRRLLSTRRRGGQNDDCEQEDRCPHLDW